MNYCYATVCTEGYISFAKMLLNSIKEKSGLILPMYIIATKQDHRFLSDKSRDELKAIYPDITFIDIDYYDYEKIGKAYPHYWSHEAFGIDGYDKVLFLDSDILIMNGLKEIFEIDCDIAMVRERQRACFNAGVVLIGKNYLNQKMHQKLKATKLNPDIFGHDQAIYNQEFKNIKPLDKKWNMLVTEWENIDDLRMLHFILKPNQDDSRRRINNINCKLLELWDIKYRESLK